MEIRLRRCKRCRRVLQSCGPCDWRRCSYCPECSPGAEEDRLKRARKKYRESPEGKAQHAAEERERRQRRKRESVGDRCRGEPGDLGSVRGQEVAPVAELLWRDLRRGEAGGQTSASLLPEEGGAAAFTPAERSPSVMVEASAVVAAGNATAVLPAGRAVTLVFPRGLRATAQALLGTTVACGDCGRGGVVASLRLEPKRRRR